MEKKAPVYLSRERKILWGCVIAYCGAYLGRHNFAMLIPSLRNEFSLSPTDVGLIVSLFALIYASGQFINGHIVDRINPRRYLIAGLIGSILCNFFLWISNSYVMVLIVWCVNGAAQSMLWSPVVRIVSLNFSKDKRSRVSFFLSISMPIATIFAWAIAGQMSAFGYWRIGALLPAILMLFALFISIFLLRDCTLSATEKQENEKPLKISYHTLLFSTGLGLLIICCIGMGFVRDSIMNWGPTILYDMTSYSAVEALRISLLVPLLSVIGIIFGRGAFLIAKFDPHRALALMASVAAGWAICLSMFGSLHALIFALMISLMTAFLQGANPMISSLIPMMYDSSGRVGSVAGTIDGSFYLGSSLSGVLTGYISMRYGWSMVLNTWWLSCLIIALFAYFSGRMFCAFFSVKNKNSSQGI